MLHSLPFGLLGTIMNSVIQSRIHVLLTSTYSHYVNLSHKDQKSSHEY